MFDTESCSSVDHDWYWTTILVYMSLFYCFSVVLSWFFCLTNLYLFQPSCWTDAPSRYDYESICVINNQFEAFCGPRFTDTAPVAGLVSGHVVSASGDVTKTKDYSLDVTKDHSLNATKDFSLDVTSGRSSRASHKSERLMSTNLDRYNTWD